MITGAGRGWLLREGAGTGRDSPSRVETRHYQMSKFWGSDTRTGRVIRNTVLHSRKLRRVSL